MLKLLPVFLIFEDEPFYFCTNEVIYYGKNKKPATNNCGVLLPDLAQILSAGFTLTLPLGVP